jgi:GT2 family glycosyltransferase
MQASVAIILVNWNSFDVTNDCIQSLKNIDYKAHRVLVVDNGSIDGSGEKLLATHPEIILIKSDTNQGFTGGNNLGFQYAIKHGFTYSIMLNNDTFVEHDFLTHLVQYMELHPNTGAIQSRIHYNHDRSILWNGGSYYSNWFGFAYTKGINQIPNKPYLQIKEVDWVTGCAFFVRNTVLEQTGLLAQNMFIYSEDVDLSFRIKALGYSLIYHPDSVVYHIAGMSNKSKTKGKEGFLNPIVHYLNFRNRIWLLKRYTKWYQTPTVLICNIFYFSLILGYFAARLRPEKLKATLKGIRDGISLSIKYH